MKYFKIYLANGENKMPIGVLFEKDAAFDLKLISLDKIPNDAKLKTHEREDLENKITKLKSSIAAIKRRLDGHPFKDIEAAQLLDIFENSELSSGEIMNASFSDLDAAKKSFNFLE